LQFKEISKTPDENHQNRPMEIVKIALERKENNYFRIAIKANDILKK